jgi:hypothetical protein
MTWLLDALRRVELMALYRYRLGKASKVNFECGAVPAPHSK